MSIERRPSDEKDHASPEQAGTVLKELDEMLAGVSYKDNLKYYRDPEDELAFLRHRLGVPVKGDENYLRLASIFFYNNDDGIHLTIYEVGKTLPGEQFLLRKIPIDMSTEHYPQIRRYLSNDDWERRRIEDRNNGENMAGEAEAEILIALLRQRTANGSYK